MTDRPDAGGTTQVMSFREPERELWGKGRSSLAGITNWSGVLTRDPT